MKSDRWEGIMMKQCIKITACLLLLLALCGCGNYEARLEGAWQGDGSLDSGIAGAIDGARPFDGAERWVFDGEESAVVTVDGRDIELHYYASDDILTLNDGGETSWGIRYEVKGDTLRIGGAEFVKVK